MSVTKPIWLSPHKGYSANQAGWNYLKLSDFRLGYSFEIKPTWFHQWVIRHIARLMLAGGTKPTWISTHRGYSANHAGYYWLELFDFRIGILIVEKN
ncbi:MAG: hypothetical protein KAZ27_17810 [Saprospiraceae bacterium]|nr:hypothetical protein [Saprospiraceae bacterium]